jgi:hypothetical protein
MSAYQSGFDDGYVEGYECKLADLGVDFAPTGVTLEVDAAATWLMLHYAAHFSRVEAIGAARAMLRAAKEAKDKPI